MLDRVSKVTIRYWEAGDWVEIDVDDKKVDYEGHSVADWYWIDLLRAAGVEVEKIDDYHDPECYGCEMCDNDD